MAKAKPLELFTLSRLGLTPHLAPAAAIEPGSLLQQLTLPAGVLFPPGGVRTTPSISEQIAVPVLAPADAAILGLEPANTPLHIVVGLSRQLHRLPLWPKEFLRSLTRFIPCTASSLKS